MPQWICLPLRTADIESILAIEHQAFSQPWDRRSLMAELSNDLAVKFTAKIKRHEGNELIIGYAIARLINDELHLLRVAVTPRWHRCGVASGLIRRCLQKARKSGAVVACLEVRPSNLPAQALYHKLGFQQFAEKPRYYTDSRESALLFRKILKEDV